MYCLFKFLTETNNVKYIRLTPTSNLHYSYYNPAKIIFNRINKMSDNLSKIVEIRITFVSCSRFMTYNHYLKQKKPMCEIRLNQILNRHPSLVYLLNTNLPHPMINHFIS